MSQPKQQKIKCGGLANPPDLQSRQPVKRKHVTNIQQRKTFENLRPNLNANQGVREDAKIIVGIDFGTTFSGFAYCSKDDPDKVFTFYEWPSHEIAGAKSYCKTQTSLRYLPGKLKDTFELQDWGWPAHRNHCKALQAQKNAAKWQHRQSVPLSTCGHFITKFKLYLPNVGSNYPSQCKLEIPEGFSVEQLIADYLQQLSIFIMEELKNKFGSSVLKKDVHWCLTVPSISTDAAKQTMMKCAQTAGLVHGLHCQDKDASVHEIVIVLEPEAASVYCFQKLKDTHNFRKGSKILVVDAGGGTVDLVAHEKLDDSGLSLKELTRSTGDLCGGSFVDEAFKNYLARKIDCFRKFSANYPVTVLTILGYWDSLKSSFDDGEQDSFDLELPTKLGHAWEADEKVKGTWSVDAQYDELVISRKDMKSIFDGQVDKILKLIYEQLVQVPQIENIMVVGGFSNSPYLMKRIRERFSDSVKFITSPIDPGSAVCQGAVAFGALGADIMMSRKSRKTYGMSMFRPFCKGDPPGSNVNSEDGQALCRDAFDVFTRIGDDVPVNHCVRRQYNPFNKGARDIVFTMYSTNDPAPAFVTDSGVEEVDSWKYCLPREVQKMKENPSVEIAMYFGRTHIEVSAEPKNFGGKFKKPMFSVVFDKALL